MSGIEVRPGTVVVYTDVLCPWSLFALHRLYQARERVGLEGRVTVDHRLFWLEDVNERPLGKRGVDAEVPALAARTPELGWQPWAGSLGAWPVTSALPNEAVHAAKRQGPAAAEQLDMALRLAFFRDSRCISLRHEVLAAAETCAAVDVAALKADLDRGVARGPMLADYEANVAKVTGSPHVFLPDGTDAFNPGVTIGWTGGEPGSGFAILEQEDPTAWDDLFRRVATADT
jgi:predicted DsbA family dithiol-disulfide isomerase